MAGNMQARQGASHAPGILRSTHSPQHSPQTTFSSLTHDVFTCQENYSRSPQWCPALLPHNPSYLVNLVSILMRKMRQFKKNYQKSPPPSLPACKKGSEYTLLSLLLWKKHPLHQQGKFIYLCAESSFSLILFCPLKSITARALSPSPVPGDFAFWTHQLQS